MLKIIIEFKAWAKPKPQGTPPTPRYGHTASKNGNQVFIFGGCSQSSVSNELFLFDSGIYFPFSDNCDNVTFNNHRKIIVGAYTIKR